MNIATSDYTSLSADLHALPNSIPSDSKSIRYSLISLRSHGQPDLPLLVDISPTIQANFVVYNCILTSVTSKKTWTVSYRYSEFDTFRTNIEDDWICHDPNCSGSCQALRDIISAYFPKKRLSIMSSTKSAIARRKRKFELVIFHLLRSVLLPGSAMKCIHARQNLPDNVFAFLGVKDADDRRLVLQIFVDDYQTVIAGKKNQSGAIPTLNVRFV